MEINEDIIRKKLGAINFPAYDEEPFAGFTGEPKPAAVLIPLMQVENEWHILYTRRAETVEHHKRQVSFPGGRADPEDASLTATALREAHEEIGLHPQDVNVLGMLGEYLTVTNYRVKPVVGVIPFPYNFQLQVSEVARVFSVPLHWLADKKNFSEILRPESGRSVITYAEYDGEVVWGATARMTVIFLSALSLI